MKFELKPYYRDISDEYLIQDVKDVAQKTGRSSVTIADYERLGKYNPSTLTRRFHSWSNVLEKAGLQESNSHPLKYSNQELFENIKDVWIALERQPRYEEMKKPLSKYSHGTYPYRFGSWQKALKAFVEWINDDSIEEEGYKKTEHDQDESLPEKAAPKKTQHKDRIEKERYIKTEQAQDESLPEKAAHQKAQHKTKRDISERLRFSILLRDGFRCQSCGGSPLKSPGVELHVDHIIPWSRGGETIPDNLQTKCTKCNLGKCWRSHSLAVSNPHYLSAWAA